jgi:hypothetical protein
MPISESYNPINDPAINPFAKRSSDVIKRFVRTATTTAGGGNGVTSLEDPTYLGFSLRFDILSPLFNGAANGAPAKPPADSSILGALGGALGLTSTAEPRLGGDISNPSHAGGESAVGYLRAVGEETRASYLEAFIQGLREVNEYRPYYWQTVDGLTDAWTKTVSMEDPFQGSGDGEGITIGCLEAVDLKISALFNLYKAAVFDAEYRRMVLPKNLMYFVVYVDVYEIRRFKSTTSWLDKLNPSAPKNDVDRFLNDNTSKITFMFDECEWVPSESGKVFESVTNAGSNEMAVTSMKWSYGRVSMISDFAGIDQELNDKSKLQTKGTLGDVVKNAAKNQLAKAANALADRAVRGVKSFGQGLLFGNAFGLQNQIISAIQNPGALVSAIEGAAAQTGGNVGRRIKLGDNMLGEGVQPGNSLPTDNINLGMVNQGVTPLGTSNIFGAGPSGPPPLEPDNVFG